MTDVQTSLLEPSAEGNQKPKAEGHKKGAAECTKPMVKPPEPPAVQVPEAEDWVSQFKSATSSKAAAGQRRVGEPRAMTIRRRPTDGFVQVRPNDSIILPLFRDKRTDQLYLFKPEAEPYLDATRVRDHKVVMAIMCGADTPFIWCLPVPQDDMGLTWHESLWAACETAEREWVRVLTDRQGDCYREQFPATELPAPTWPEMTLASAIKTAFKSRAIDGPDHPVILRMEGKIV